MGIHDYIATTEFSFDKEAFFSLIDAEGKLDAESKQNFWGEYAMYCKKNLTNFYKSLDDVAPTHQYVKKSINLFFKRQ